MSWQRVNHFRNGRELCRKDLLVKNIKRAKRTLDKSGKPEEAARFDFCPVTFVLPGDYALFVEEFNRCAGTVWIMKPIGRAQGKGIFLFHKLSQISQWKSEHRWKPDTPGVETYVVQKYIPNPYLVSPQTPCPARPIPARSRGRDCDCSHKKVGGKKFDMRMYALVTSFNPLKTSTEYNADTGGKWDLQALKMFVAAKHGRAACDALFMGMQDIVVNSLLGVQKVMISDRHCFELYGYDLLFDDDLRPWLIEVNASPSVSRRTSPEALAVVGPARRRRGNGLQRLTANTRADYDTKFKMLSDLLDIVDLEGVRTGTERTVGGFDLIWDDGPVEPLRTELWTSMLGADFDRRLNPVPTRPAEPPAPAAAAAASSGPTGSSSAAGRRAGGGSSRSLASARRAAAAAAASSATAAGSSGTGSHRGSLR
ncbi:TTLL9 [Symbiodinium sp. KB8]|nr:TTLL9 [Symbiodinium sp. KB8]